MVDPLNVNRRSTEIPFPYLFIFILFSQGADFQGLWKGGGGGGGGGQMHPSNPPWLRAWISYSSPPKIVFTIASATVSASPALEMAACEPPLNARKPKNKMNPPKAAF